MKVTLTKVPFVTAKGKTVIDIVTHTHTRIHIDDQLDGQLDGQVDGQLEDGIRFIERFLG